VIWRAEKEVRRIGRSVTGTVEISKPLIAALLIANLLFAGWAESHEAPTQLNTNDPVSCHIDALDHISLCQRVRGDAMYNQVECSEYPQLVFSRRLVAFCP
jgi:hypothetical protein